jgi:hypothetical protein
VNASLAVLRMICGPRCTPTFPGGCYRNSSTRLRAGQIKPREPRYQQPDATMLRGSANFAVSSASDAGDAALKQLTPPVRGDVAFDELARIRRLEVGAALPALVAFRRIDIWQSPG